MAVSDDARWLDGNAAGGMLAELFGAEMTASPRRCGSCQEVHPVGAHRLYQGAGFVLRCPNCGDVALRAAAVAGGQVVELRGTWQVVQRAG
jgi:uncharacterized protein DUF6510